MRPTHLFAGDDKNIYALAFDGDQLWYKDASHDCTPSWAAGLDNRVGSNWQTILLAWSDLRSAFHWLLTFIVALALAIPLAAEAGDEWTREGAVVRLSNSDDWVGIGTESPRHRLSIGGGPMWTSTGWGGALELLNAGAIGWRPNTAGNAFGIGHTDGGLFFFRTKSEPGTRDEDATYDLQIHDSGLVSITGNASIGGNTDIAGNLGIGNFGDTPPNARLSIASSRDVGGLFIDRLVAQLVPGHPEDYSFRVRLTRL